MNDLVSVTEKFSRICSVFGCTNNDTTHTFYSFPKIEKQVIDNKQLKRCKIWIQRAGNSSLLTIDPLDIHKEAFLCHAHFDIDDLRGGMKMHERASIPSIFYCSPLADKLLIKYGSKSDNTNNAATQPDKIRVDKNNGEVDSRKPILYPLGDGKVKTRNDTNDNHSTPSEKNSKGCLKRKVEETTKYFDSEIPDPQKKKQDERSSNSKANEQRRRNQSREAMRLKRLNPAFLEAENAKRRHKYRETIAKKRKTKPGEESVENEEKTTKGRKLKKKRPSRRCAAVNCSNNDTTHSCFAFPKLTRYVGQKDVVENARLERCKIWIKRAGDKLLLTIDPLEIHKNTYLCEAHFDDKDVTYGQNKTITKTCIPTTFNCRALPDELLIGYGSYLRTASDNTEKVLQNATNPEGSQSENDPSDSRESLTSSCNNDAVKNDINGTISGLSMRELARKDPKIICVAVNCSNSNASHIFFAFPKIEKQDVDKEELERCRIWIQRSGNSSLLMINPVDLHEKVFLCHTHFNICDKQSGENLTLQRDAVPSIFTCSPLPRRLLDEYGSSLWNTSDDAITSNILPSNAHCVDHTGNVQADPTKDVSSPCMNDNSKEELKSCPSDDDVSSCINSYQEESRNDPSDEESWINYDYKSKLKNGPSNDTSSCIYDCKEDSRNDPNDDESRVIVDRKNELRRESSDDDSSSWVNYDYKRK